MVPRHTDIPHAAPSESMAESLAESTAGCCKLEMGLPQEKAIIKGLILELQGCREEPENTWGGQRLQARKWEHQRPETDWATDQEPS